MIKLNKSLKVVDNGELCCGSVLYTTGQENRAGKNRLEVEKHLREKKISEMVMLCPGCLRTFNDFYVPRRNNPLKKVEHYTQLIVPELSKLEFKQSRRKNPKKVTYHDPCHLGRHLGIYDEPRAILSHMPGYDFVELPTNCENSFCCGSGAGVRASNKELADYTSALRLREALSIEADIMVTSCPFCERSFLAAQKVHKDVRGIKIRNLAVFMEENLK
jgi:heterodisulfide reductase subunit D